MVVIALVLIAGASAAGRDPLVERFFLKRGNVTYAGPEIYAQGRRLKTAQLVLAVNKPAGVAEDAFMPAVLTNDIARVVRDHINDQTYFGKEEWYETSDVNRHFKERTELLGLNGRSAVSPFAIACTLTHRRAWERIVNDPTMLDYAIVYEADAAFDVQDDQSHYTDRNQYISYIVDVVSNLDPGWELVNLGRCWDFCENQKVIHQFSPTQSVVKSLSPSCTHAYIVSRTGAKKLLQWSLPFTMPVDYLLDMLGRTKILSMYSISNPAFFQAKSDDANDKGNLLECDPDEKAIMKKHPIKSIANDDQLILRTINASWVSNWVRDSLAANDYDESITFPGPPVSDETTCNPLAEFCEWIAGANHEGPEEAEFLRLMDTHGLDTFMVWGLQLNEVHTHRYIHAALKEAAQRAFTTSLRPRRVCWVPSSTILCDVRGDGEPLVNALVVATPKHMAYTADPALKHLPVSSKNKYIFHELAPPQFHDLQKLGNVVQWVVRGPDGSSPVLEAEHYTLKQTVPCRGADYKCIYGNTYVAPWGTRYRPDPNDAIPPPGTKADPTTIHFIGTIWWLNKDAWCDFVAGCNAVGVKVVRSGLARLPKKGWRCDGRDVEWDEDWRAVPDDERQQLMWNSAFVPAFQGANHINGNASYIPDRIIDAVALGMKVVTNNKYAADIFGVPYTTPYDMCALNQRSPIPFANPMNAATHTYLSRLNDMLDLLLQNPRPQPFR